MKFLFTIGIIILTLPVLVFAISCGNNVCEDTTITLTTEEPVKVVEINGYQETFELDFINETNGEHKFNINGEYYLDNVDRYFKLFESKGYTVDSVSTVFDNTRRIKVSYEHPDTGEILTSEEVPAQGITIRINEDFYCLDCRPDKRTIEVKTGWNLIQNFNSWHQNFQETTCDFSKGSYLYFYDSFNKKYQSMFVPEGNLPDILNDGPNIYVSSTNYVMKNVLSRDVSKISDWGDKRTEYIWYRELNSIWVHSDTACNVVLNYPEDYTTRQDTFGLFTIGLSTNTRKFVEGWNLISVYFTLPGRNLDSMRGNCDFTKAFMWDSEEQGWKDLDGSYTFSPSDYGQGIAIKTSAECTPKIVE